jgi:hypothetical protein
VKAASAIKALEPAEHAAMLASKGVPPAAMDYLISPVRAGSMGMHWIPRKFRLPWFLGGGPLPEAFMESQFNVYHAPHLSRGEVNTEHFKNDLDYHGQGIPGFGKGQGWSGHRLGIERRGPLGRFWFGAPPATKGLMGSAATGTVIAASHVRGDRR